jgi:hypothetical protein
LHTLQSVAEIAWRKEKMKSTELFPWYGIVFSFKVDNIRKRQKLSPSECKQEATSTLSHRNRKCKYQRINSFEKNKTINAENS